MTILRELLNAGILAGDAQVLDSFYGNQDATLFLDGLEQVARCILTKEPPGTLPMLQCTPWDTVLKQLQSAPDQDAGFTTAIGILDAPLQVALSRAVDTRLHELQQWQQQTGQGKRRKTSQYVRALAGAGYKFKYNLAGHDIEVNGVKITDEIQKEIRGKMRDAGIWEVNVIEDAYQADAWKNRYHPVRDYLTSLKFDGHDAITELAGYFRDEHDVFAVWLKRWLVGAVARVMAGEQNRVLVLDGYQGIGKSHLAEWLGSPMPEYYHEGPVLPEDKDCRIRRMSTWVWEINEFGATTRRADVEALKAFLTTNIVRERRPYARYDVQGPAMASFIGTVNNQSGILNDPTGSRRFMIAHLLGIDWSYTKLDVDQVWAQAFDLYLSGEPWNLDDDERKQANDINDQYQMVDLVEETIKKWFVIDTTNASAWLSTVEIMDVLRDPLRGNLKAGSEIDTRRLASALTKLGLDRPKLRKIHGQGMRGYYGIRLGP